jgi:hypothetical protein
MPLDEREKKELEKKIKAQRRSMWKGEVTSENRIRRSGEKREARPISRDQQEYGKETAAQRGSAWKEAAAARNRVRAELEIREDELVPDDQQKSEEAKLASKIVEQRKFMWEGQASSKREKKKKRGSKKTQVIINERQSDEPGVKRKERDTRSSVPSLKLALIVIISFIGAVILGISIGYLAAVRDLINI